MQGSPVAASPGPEPEASREVILVRTHYFDEDLRGYVDALSLTGRTVCLVMDEIRNPVAVPDGYAKISLTSPAIAAMGLRESRNTGWQCGDYGFYLGAQRYPEATHFWVIEPDVCLNFTNPADFFSFFAARPGIDLLACDLREGAFNWFWHGSAAAHFAQVERCLFPVVRVSRKAIDAMLEARRAIAAKLSGADLRARPELWPNDEALTASACRAAGLACADINACGRWFYGPATFSFDMPVSGRMLAAGGVDGMIYHPVLAGDRFRAKVEQHLQTVRETRSLDLLTRINRRVLAGLAQECGPVAAREIAAQVAELAREIEMRPLVRAFKSAAYRARRWGRAYLLRQL